MVFMLSRILTYARNLLLARAGPEADEHGNLPIEAEDPLP